MKVTDNFTLSEFMPRANVGPVPERVVENITRLCTDLLQPARDALGPIRITSGWRPPAHNAEIGGAKGSDHVTGSAADLKHNGVEGSKLLFRWIRDNLAGKFGQLIWEDRRVVTGLPGDFCVHVSLPTARHPGKNDPATLLVSKQPGHYRAFLSDEEDLA